MNKKYIIEVATNKASLEKLRSDLEKATQLPKEGVEVPALSREAKAQVKKDLATMFGVAEHQADALQKMMQAAADGFANGKSVEEMKNQLKETLEFTNSIMQRMHKMGEATDWMKQGVTFVDDFIKMKDSIGSIKEVEKSVHSLEKTFGKFKDALAETNADAFLQRFGNSTRSEAESLAKAQKELDRLAKTRNKNLQNIMMGSSDEEYDYSGFSAEQIKKEYQIAIQDIEEANKKIEALRNKYRGKTKELYNSSDYQEQISIMSDAMNQIKNLPSIAGDGLGESLRASLKEATDSVKSAGTEIQNVLDKLKGDGIKVAITVPDASSVEFVSQIDKFIKKATEQFQSKPITVSLDVTNPFKDIDVKEFSKKQKEMADRTKNTAQNALKGISGTEGDNGDLSILDNPEVGKILRRLYDSFEKIKKGVVSGQKSITDATKEWRREIDEELKLKFTWETSSNADQIQQMFDIIQDIAEDNPIHLFADTVSFIDDIQDALKDIKISINADIDNATIKSFSAPSDDIKKEFKSFKSGPIKPVLEEDQDSNELSENSRALNTSTKSNNSLVEALNKLNTSINDTEQKKARAQTRKAEIESVAKKNAPTIKNKEKLIEENDRKITPLKQTQSKMKKEVDAIRKEIADIEKQRDNQADIKKLSIERDELRGNNRDGQFNDKIRELITQIEQISEPYNAKIEEITRMKLTPAIKVLEDVNTKISKLNDANTALVNEVDRLKQTSELEAQDKVIKSTTKDLPKLTRRRDAVQSVIDNNQDITSLILEPLDSFYQKIEKTKEKADGINKNLEAKKKDLSDAEVELQKLDANTNKDAAEALKTKIVKLKSDVTELTTELEATTKTLDTSNVRKQLLEQKGFKDVRGLTEDDRTTFATNLLKQSATLADELQNTSLRVDGNDIKLSIKSLQDLIYFIPEVQNTLGVVAKSSDQWANEKNLQERFINIFKLANQLKALGNISVKNDVAPTTEAIQEFIGVFEHVPVMAKVIEAAKEYLEKALALSDNTDADKVAALTSGKDAALNTLMETINGKRKDETIDGKQVSTYVPGAKSMIKDMMNGQEPLHVKVVGGSGTEKTYGLKRSSRDANLDVTGRNYTFANAGRAAKRFGIDSLLAERFDIEATFGTLDAMRAERAAIAKELNDISQQEGNVTEAEKAALQTKKQELTTRLDFIKMADTRIGEIDDEIAKKVEISTKKNAPIRTSRKSYEYGSTEFSDLQKERQEKVRQLESLNAQEETENIKRSKELIKTRISEIDSLLSLGNAQGVVVDGIRALNNDVAISTAKVDEAKRAVKEYDKELKNGFTVNDNGKAWAYDKIQREHKNAVIGRFGRTYSNDYTKTVDMNQERWADFRHRLTTAKDNKTMNVDVISDIENMLNLRDSAIQELDSMTESQKKTSEGTKRVAELKKILLENSRDAILKKYYDTEGWYLNDLLSQRLKNIDLEFEQAKKSIQSGNASSQSAYAKQIEEENRRYAQELKVLEQQRASTVSAYNIDEQSVVSAYLRNNEEVFSSAFSPILGKLLSQKDQETKGLSTSSNEYKTIQQKYLHLIDEERAKLKASFLTPIEEYQQLIDNLPNPDDVVNQRKAEIKKALSDSFALEVQNRGLKLGTDEYKALESEYSTKLNARYTDVETSYRSAVSSDVERQRAEIETKLRNFIVELVDNHKKQLIENFNKDRGADQKVKSLEEIRAILSEGIDTAIKNAAKVHADNLSKILPEDVKTDEQIQEDINKKSTERDAKKAQAVSEVMTGGKYISDMDLMRQETEKQRDAAQRVYEAEKQVLAQKQEQVETLRQEYNITDKMLQHSEAVAQAQQKQTQTRKQTANEFKEYTSDGSVPSGGYYAGGIIDTSNLATESTLRGIYQLLNGGPPKGGWGDDGNGNDKYTIDNNINGLSKIGAFVKNANFVQSLKYLMDNATELKTEAATFVGNGKFLSSISSGKTDYINYQDIVQGINAANEKIDFVIHNHPDAPHQPSYGDILTGLDLAYSSKFKQVRGSGSYNDSGATLIDYSDIPEDVARSVIADAVSQWENELKLVGGKLHPIMGDIQFGGIQNEGKTDEEYAKLYYDYYERFYDIIKTKFAQAGYTDVLKSFSYDEIATMATQQVAESIIESGSKTAVEAVNKSAITKENIKSKQTALQEKFKTKNAETGRIEYSVKGASKIDQALYNVGDKLTKEALTDGDLTKLTKAYSQLENAFKEEIISHLGQETIDFLNVLRGQISSVLDANSSRLSAKDQQSKAITEAKDYLSKLKTEDGKRVSGTYRASTGIDQVYDVLNKGKEELSDKDLTSIAQGYYRLQQTVNHAVFEKLDENTKKVINDAIQEAKSVLDKNNVTVQSDELVGTVLDDANAKLFTNANKDDRKKKAGRTISSVIEPQVSKNGEVISKARVYLDGTSKKQAEERAAAEAIITQEKKEQNQLAAESAQVENKATEQAKERAKTEKQVTESKKKTQAVDAPKVDSGAGNAPPSTPSNDVRVTDGGGNDGGILGLLSRIAQESTLQSILGKLSSGVKTTSDKKGGSGKKKSDKPLNITADDAWATAQDYIKKNYPNFTSLGSLKSVSGGYSLDVFQPKNLEAFAAAQKRVNNLIAEGKMDTDDFKQAQAELNGLKLEQEKITLRIGNLNDEVQVTQEKSSFQNLALGIKAASKELQTVEGVLTQLHEVGVLSIGNDGAPVSSVKSVKKYLDDLKALQNYQSKLSPDQLFNPEVQQNLSKLALDLQNSRKEMMTLLKTTSQFNVGKLIDTDKLANGISGLSNDEVKKLMLDIVSDGNKLETTFKELIPITDEFDDVIGYQLAYSVRTGKHEMQEMTAVLNPLTNELRVQKGAVKEVTTGWQQFFNGLKGKAASIMQYLISITSIHDVFRYFSQGVQYVREIDGALTELKKVTDETDASYAQFLQNMSKTGSVIGATVADLTTMASEWARLGYSMDDAGRLAESTAILLNVSEFDDATKASEALISTMQAFQYTADESQHVVDVLNEVGNNYAVSSDGIATALQDSASALMEAGNNLEQSVALVAAANKVVQDPNSVGSALRTISLRLRGTSVEVLEEMGEETDGVVESVSKMQEKIEALTGVNILTDSREYKETYQILYEIGQVWKDMSDIDQAALLELMAGKNRANTLAAILGNMEDLEGAYESALNAEGSAMRENQAYLDSIQGRIDLFNNALQTFWMNLLNTELIKGVVDTGTSLIKIADTLIGKLTAIFAILAVHKKFTSKLSFAEVFSNAIDPISRVLKSFKTMTVATTSQAIASKISNKEIAQSILLTSGLSTSEGVLTKELIASTAAMLTNEFQLGNLSAAEYIATMSTMGLKTALQGLWNVLLKHPFVLVASAAALVGVALDALTTTVQEASDAAKEAFDEIQSIVDSTKSTIQSLESELSTLNDKIEELDGKNLSFADREELDRLKEQRTELEHSLKIQKQLLELQTNSRNKQAVASMEAYTKAASQGAEETSKTSKAIGTVIGAIGGLAIGAGALFGAFTGGTSAVAGMGLGTKLLTTAALMGGLGFAGNKAGEFVGSKISENDGTYDSWYGTYTKAIETARAEEEKALAAYQNDSSNIDKLDKWREAQQKTIDIETEMYNHMSQMQQYYNGLEYGQSEEIDQKLDEWYNFLDKFSIENNATDAKANALDRIFGANASDEIKSIKEQILEAVKTGKDFDFTSAINGSQELKSTLDYVGLSAEEVNNYFTQIGEAGSNITQEIAPIATYSDLLEDVEAYKEILSQTSEIVSDNTEVTQEYKDSLIALGASEEDLNKCFYENNKLVVKDSKSLHKLVTQLKNNNKATIAAAKAQAQLQYKELTEQMRRSIITTMAQTSAYDVIADAARENISVMRSQLEALEQTIQQYSLLEISLSNAANAYNEYEKAKERDAQLTYDDSFLEMLKTIDEGILKNEAGTEAFEYAVKAIVPEEFWKDIDNVDEKIKAIHDYIDGDPVFAKLFNVDEESGNLDINADNVREFVNMGLTEDVGVFTGDSAGDFELSDNIEGIEDIANAYGITEAAALALLTALEKVDAKWSDILTEVMMTPFDRKVYDATKEIAEANNELADAQVKLADGTITLEEYNKIAEEYRAKTSVANQNLDAYTKQAKDRLLGSDNGTEDTTDDTLGFIELNKQAVAAQEKVTKSTEELIAAQTEYNKAKDAGASDEELKIYQEEVDNATIKVNEHTEAWAKLIQKRGDYPSEYEISLVIADIDKEIRAAGNKFEKAINANFHLEDGFYVINTGVNIQALEAAYPGIIEYIDLCNTKTEIETFADTTSAEEDVNELKKTVNHVIEAIEDNLITLELDERAVNNIVEEANKILSGIISNLGITISASLPSWLQSVLGWMGFDTSNSKQTPIPSNSSKNLPPKSNANTRQNLVMALGNAREAGSNGIKNAEHDTVMGELGPELVCDPIKGIYYTVGDNGTEMVNLPKGAIVYNHKQTAELLKNGRTTRGKYTGGLSFASGNAYGFGIPSHHPNTEDSTSFANGTDINRTWDDAASSLSDAAENLSDATDEFKEVFDWVEIRLEEIDEDLNLLSAQLENATYYNDKNNIINSMIGLNETKMTNLIAGMKEYEEYASALLSKIPAQYRQAVQDGAIAIEQFAGEADEKTLEAINNYREWAQKVSDLRQQLEETKTTIRDLAIQKFDNASEFGDVRVAVEDSQTEKLQNAVDLIEEKGNIAGEEYYTAMMENSNKKIEYLTKSRNAMQKELDNAVWSGQIEKGSNEWYELVNQMYEVDAAIDEATIELEQFQNAINDIEWENFDQLINRIDYLKDDTKNLIDLMSNEDMFVDQTGKDYWGNKDVIWTDEGLSTLGLYAQQMEIAEFEARQYSEAIDKLTADYKDGLYSENEYLEKLNELKSSQYDSIQAYEDAKDAIVDLNKARIDHVKEGIEKEIDAYSELIEKKKEALSAEQDLHDFQKSVMEQQKDIADIERQLAALEYDNSSEARAKKAQLQAELAEANNTLSETYYARSIENQQQALDQELEDFQESKEKEIESLELYLENVEQVVADSLMTVQANTVTIYDTLNAKADEYGLNISEAITTPWQDGSLAISDYQETFDTAASSTMDQLDLMKDKWQAVIDKMLLASKFDVGSINKENNGYVQANAGGNSISANNTSATLASNKNTTTNSPSTKPASKAAPSVGSTVKVKKNATHFSSKSNNLKMASFVPGGSYTVYQTSDGQVLIGRDGVYTGWVKQTDLEGYAKGTKGVSEDQWAILDELGEELTLHAHNGRLAYLEKGSGVIPEKLTSNLMEWGKLDPSIMLDQNRPTIGAHPEIHQTEIKLDITYGDMVSIGEFHGDNLADLEKMVAKQFEKHTKNLNNALRRYTRG